MPWAMGIVFLTLRAWETARFQVAPFNPTSEHRGRSNNDAVT